MPAVNFYDEYNLRLALFEELMTTAATKSPSRKWNKAIFGLSGSYRLGKAKIYIKGSTLKVPL